MYEKGSGVLGFLIYQKSHCMQGHVVPQSQLGLVSKCPCAKMCSPTANGREEAAEGRERRPRSNSACALGAGAEACG